MRLEHARVDLLQRDVAAVGVAEPAARDVVVDRGRLDGAVEPAEPVGEQLLAADAHAGEAGRAGVALEVAGRERVDVDHRLQRVVVGLRAVRWPLARRAAPTSRRHTGAAARPARFGTAAMPVAVARRLAGEQQHAAGAQHAQELGERAVELRQVVQHRVAEHEVERRVVERQRRRVARDGLDLQAEPLRVARAASRACRARRRCRPPPRSTPACIRLSVK